MTSKLKTDVLETVSGSGTIALTNQLSGMTSASVPQLTAAQMPAGSSLQTLSTIYATVFATTTTAWVDTGLTITITPHSTSSKFNMNWAQTLYHNSGTTVNWLGFKFRVVRDSTNVYTETYGLSHAFYYGWQNVAHVGHYMDSPNTTSAITYKIQLQPYSGSTHYFNDGSSPSFLTITEIKG
jgi:hypothetical protein